MEIVFVLPNAGIFPIGGLKVVYEYANHLSRRGHRITLVHAAFQRIDTPLSEWPRRTLYYLRHKIIGSYGPSRWFAIDPSVSLRWVPTLDARFIPSADVIVATSWDTAEWVNRYESKKGKKFYLVQGLETWRGDEKRVYATWRMPLAKVTISAWLKRIIEEAGETTDYIPNGLDFQKFSLDVPSEDRDRNQVTMLYHSLQIKGSADGLAALSIAKHRIPNLRASLFGVSDAPKPLPEWIGYHRIPSQEKLRHLYNQAAIFVSPSWSEGWPLPPAEAMMSGAAVAATDIGGHREYAFHEETALLSPPKDPEALAANIVRLMSDDNLRIKIARQGHQHIQRFTWDKAVERFEAALTRH